MLRFKIRTCIMKKQDKRRAAQKGCPGRRTAAPRRRRKRSMWMMHALNNILGLYIILVLVLVVCRRNRIVRLVMRETRM